MTYYAILPVEKINLPDWSQLDQDRDTARKSSDGAYIVVSFLKAYKEEFESITEEMCYNPLEIDSVLSDINWLAEDDLDLE